MIQGLKVIAQEQEKKNQLKECHKRKEGQSRQTGPQSQTERPQKGPGQMMDR